MKKILVALDLSKIDKSLVKYTSYLTTIFAVEKVFLFIISKNTKLQIYLKNNYKILILSK